ncbi:MAG: phosphate/phosphite/phosphonate ABC transporter substrate-binding protein [Pseudomonadota bacterium]
MSERPHDGCLVAGYVSHNFKKHLRDLTPINQYLAATLSDKGIDKTEVKLSNSLESMRVLLGRGEVDWVTAQVFGASILVDAGVAEVLAQRWKKGRENYRSLLFVRADSGIGSMAELRGRVVAFEDPSSTTGWFIPASTLVSKGLELNQLQSPRSSARPDLVNFVFAREEINISTWVFKGLAQAGALSDGDWTNPKRVPTQFRKQLKILHKSVPYPRSLILVRKSLDPRMKEILKSALLTAHDDRSAEQALRAFHRTSKFTPVNDTVIRALERARALRRTVLPDVSP